MNMSDLPPEREESEESKNLTKVQDEKNKTSIWRKPWRKTKFLAKDIHSPQSSHTNTTSHTSPPLPGLPAEPADQTDQPCNLSFRKQKPFLCSAASAAYSAGTVVASIAAAAVLFKLPPSQEPFALKKTSSTPCDCSAPTLESRLKTLEEEAVVAALAAAAATAAAAAERARIAAHAAMAIQAEHGYGKKADEITCSTLPSDVEENSLNGTISQSPRQSEVLSSSTSKRRRMPKSRLPLSSRPSAAVPRTGISGAPPRPSGISPRISGPRSAAEDLGISQATLATLTGASAAKAAAASPALPRFAARLAELVSSAAPNNIPSGGGFAQLKTPVVKAGRGSISRTMKLGNRRPSSPAGASNAAESAPAPGQRSSLATHPKPPNRHGVPQGQSPAPHSHPVASIPRPSSSHLQPSSTHPQPSTIHSLPTASHPQSTATRYQPSAMHPQPPTSRPQMAVSHSQINGPQSQTSATRNSQSQGATINLSQSISRAQPLVSQHQQPTSHPQLNTQSGQPAGKLSASSSAHPPQTYPTSTLAAPVAATHSLHTTAGNTPAALIQPRFAAPPSSNITPSSQHYCTSPLNNPNAARSCETPPANTVAALISHPLPSESNRAHVSPPLSSQHQYVQQPVPLPLPPPPPHSYGTLPSRSVPSVTESSAPQVHASPPSQASVPHVTLAMLSSIPSHQWLQRHPVETAIKAHRAAPAQRPSSATMSSIGLRGRVLSKTSMSAAALDRPKTQELTVNWAGGKIAAPADDDQYPENVPSSSETTDNERSSWSYRYESAPFAQETTAQWSAPWTGVKSAPLTEPTAKDETMHGAESWSQDSFHLGVNTIPATSGAMPAWDLNRSSSINSLLQSYIPTDASATQQANNSKNWWPKESVSSEQKPTCVRWDKDGAIGTSLPSRTSLMYQTTWLHPPRAQAAAQWMRSTPTIFNDKDKSLSDALGGTVEALDNALRISYQDALYQQTLQQTFDAVCFQQQRASQQSLQMQQPQQTLYSQPPLQSQSEPLPTQQSLPPQQPQQQRFPETVFEETSPEKAQ